MKCIGIDTTPSNGSIALKGNRDVKHGNMSTSKAGLVPLGMDITPSRGSNALNGNRDISAEGRDGWSAKGQSSIKVIGIDTTPSNGSIALKGNRDVKHGNMSTSKAGLVPLGMDSTPSGGSNALKGNRDVAAEGRDGWSAKGQSSMKGIGIDTTPSAGSNTLKTPRDLNHNYGWKDGKKTTMVGLGIDTTPTSRQHHPRDFEGSTGMAGGRGFGADFDVGVVRRGELGSPEFDDDTSENDAWRSGTHVDDVMSENLLKEKPIFVESVGDVSKVHNFREDEPNTRSKASKSWRPVGTNLTTFKTPTPNTEFVVKPVLTTEEVRSFKFRQLEKMHSKIDWNFAVEKPTGNGNGLFQSTPLLEREPYVDPNRRNGPLRPAAPTQRTSPGAAKGNAKRKNWISSPPPQRKHVNEKAEVVPEKGAKLPPNKNGTFGIQAALKRREEERGAGEPAAGATEPETLTKPPRSVKPRAETLSLTIAAYNKSVVELAAERDYLVQVLELADQLVDDTRDSRGGAFVHEVQELTEKSRTSTQKAHKLLCRPKTFARKAAGTVLPLFEYRELAGTRKAVREAVVNANRIRQYVLEGEAKAKYAQFGIEPRISVVYIPDKTPLGVEVRVTDDAAFGVRIGKIQEESAAAVQEDMQPGCALLEIDGEFLVDLSKEEIQHIIDAQRAESIITYLPFADVRPLGEVPGMEEDDRYSNGNDQRGPEPDELLSSPSHQGKYRWQITSPDQEYLLESRREELLRESSLAEEPELMEEWLALLVARKQLLGDGPSAGEEVPAPQAPAKEAKKSRFSLSGLFSKLKRSSPASP
jgi:hypothetical protein